MYGYHKVEGQVLSEAITVPLMRRLLSHSRGFWSPCTLSPAERKQFRADCHRFYHDKTLERVSLFHHKSQLMDGEESINDIPMPTLAHLLEKIDWSYLADGIASRFHGDFHFENILWESKNQTFTFLDWRQDFAGSLVRGDIYYDFAKLLHGLIISHELIDRNLFSVDWGAEEIRYDFHRKQILVDCEQDFSRWLSENEYDAKKVYLLTALIFLNIAPLHHHPYDNLLFALGKKMLRDHLLS
jgi:thiamine kinase-like enzyme